MSFLCKTLVELGTGVGLYGPEACILAASRRYTASWNATYRAEVDTIPDKGHASRVSYYTLWKSIM